MHDAKFKPGDRVVNTSFSSKHEGIGGTVMQVSRVGEIGPFRFVIILDTAEHLIVQRIHSWVREQDWIDGSYIPF